MVNIMKGGCEGLQEKSLVITNNERTSIVRLNSNNVSTALSSAAVMGLKESDSGSHVVHYELWTW